MKTAGYIFPITAMVVFLQAITGAATVQGFYDFGLHTTTGYLVAVLALISTAVAFASKPKYSALRYASLVLFLLALLQGGIGFMAQTSDQIVVAHFADALILYGVSIAIVFYSFRWGRIGAPPAIQA